MKKIVLAIALFISVLGAQAQTKSVPNNSTEKPADEEQSLAKGYFSQVMGVALSATSNVKLFQFVYDWIGTPYRFGGQTKRGIDCSAFTKELYTNVFNHNIKRNRVDLETAMGWQRDQYFCPHIVC